MALGKRHFNTFFTFQYFEIKRCNGNPALDFKAKMTQNYYHRGRLALGKSKEASSRYES